MRERCYIVLSLGLILVNSLFLSAYAQLGFDLKIDKPEPYEERVLRAEKPQDKPLRAQGRFFQNLTTHYNYFFNANTKINEVIDAAKRSFKDDYTTLLPFYNYSLDATAASSTELDSVVYKAQTGIVMHDLRNDWIDNMYLLWGAAWFLEKKFDSASLMFQFINYAFAEKEKDGYYRYIGSRMDGSNALTISTKEKSKNVVTPPSRNNAFIWQARTMIEMGNMAEAGSLIVTLKNDPHFPERLHQDLEEVQAYWFYKQNMWDSSAYHLLKALDQAKNKQEKARWEYLAAQMLERAGSSEEAQKWYTRSIAHTTDPVMDVYARLNLVRIRKDTTKNYIDKNIAELIKMARRDKYVDYRDVIYYMAAQMELERKNFGAAQKLLLKSVKYNNNNLASGKKTYLMIADMSFDQKRYLEAAAFYDSIQTRDLEEGEMQRVEQRKNMLTRIVALSSTITRQDSLQRIASMPEEERTEYIEDLVKQLRKQQGLEEITPTSGGSTAKTNAPTDLFTTQQKGEWYFYNATLKKQGNSNFKQTWGNRPNVDNWRRFSDVSQQLNSNQLSPIKGANKTVETNDQLDNSPSYASLLKNLPLTAPQLSASNDSIRNALISLGKIYLNEVEDVAAAIETFEQLRTRFPDKDYVNEEVLFNLYYAYKKSGNEVKAEEIKRSLLEHYADSRFASILLTGKDPSSVNNKEEATNAYESIYDLFLAGRFTDAIVAKKKADSIYKTNYWEPQLLYIESVYHIRQRNDSLAKDLLQTLISQNDNVPLAAKAQTMIDVLNRRNEIEAELTALQIVRPQEEVIKLPGQVKSDPVNIQRDSLITIPKTQVKDSSVALPKKDIAINHLPKPAIDTSLTRVPVNQTKKDTVVAIKDPVSQPRLHPSGYMIDSTTRHFAMIILDRVDPLFVNEVNNAFQRYGRDRYYSQPFEYTLKDLDADKKILLIGYFNSAKEAAEFIQRAKPSAASEIMPWLKADKYSFSIITDYNLDLLLQKKDLNQYAQFLDQVLRIGK